MRIDEVTLRQLKPELKFVDGMILKTVCLVAMLRTYCTTVRLMAAIINTLFILAASIYYKSTKASATITPVTIADFKK